MPGSSGDKLCPICDSPLQPGSKKCGFCGTDLSIFDMDVEAPKPAPPPVAAPAPKPSVESRIEEIFSKPIAPERPSPARQPEPSYVPPAEHVAPPSHEAELVEEQVTPLEQEVKPVPRKREIAEEAVEYFECPQCGSLVETTANSCPKCGVLFAEEGADTFQCPACSTLVNVDATTCPGCGAVFVEAEEEQPAAAPPPPVKRDLEPPVTEVKPPPKAAPAPPKEEERKGLFGGLFKKARKEEAPPPPKPAKPAVREVPALTRRPAEAPPAAGEPRPLRPEPVVAPAIKDKGKELARMVAEMKPLLSLAREKDVDIGDSKQLIDEAAVAGRERQLDRAIELVQRSKDLLMREIDAQLAKEIARLNEEIRVASEFGGDVARATTYVQEISRARSSGDVEAAYVYVDKVKKELLPITGRYNESKKRLANFKQLISDAEAFLVDTKEARGLLVDAAKAMDSKDFDRLETLTKTAQEKLYMAIPARMNDEMRKAKDDLLDAKMKNVNITPMITILKSATNLMKAGDYAQALREMREFKDMMKKSK